jgi:hypothetical protein
MAYETTNPPRVIVSAGIAGPAIWLYRDGDAHTDVDAAGYFTNGKQLGMKVGDILYVQNDTTYLITIHSVLSFSTNAATITQAVLA